MSVSRPLGRSVLAAFAIASAMAGAAGAAGSEGKPRTATGRVTDVHGRPVPGATIEVGMTSRDYRDVTLGKGVSDEDGRFTLSLTTDDYGDLGLGVEAPGFARWGRAGFPGGIVDERVVLRRVVDRAFLDDLRTVRDPAERGRRALEIAASDDLPDIEEIFPYLRELRPELVAIVRAGTAEPADWRDGTTPAHRASRLLAYWADPADDALLRPWVLEHWGARPAHVAHLGLSAASIDEVCSRWREIHLADQGISDSPPPAACLTPLLDLTRTHAVVVFQVRYAHWGYSMPLVMRREGEAWTLRGVGEDTIFHLRP